MPLNHQNAENTLRNKHITETCQKAHAFDSPPTFYYPMWMGFGMPLFEINQEKYENVCEDSHARKILTNVTMAINVDNNQDPSQRMFSMKKLIF
jgi:hypothetical protein